MVPLTIYMVQLVLICPGLTDYDEQGRVQGALDIPLNDAGRREAVEAAQKLRPYLPFVLYTSPTWSAKETAEIIGSSLDLKPKVLDRLQNWNQGLWQGLLVDEIRRKQPKVYKQWQEHPEIVCPPEGETLSEVLHRVEETLEKLARKHRQGTIAVVVPEPLAAIIRHRLEGTEIEDLWHVTSSGCRMEVFHLEPMMLSAPIAHGFEAASTPQMR